MRALRVQLISVRLHGGGSHLRAAQAVSLIFGCALILPPPSPTQAHLFRACILHAHPALSEIPIRHSDAAYTPSTHGGTPVACDAPYRYLLWGCSQVCSCSSARRLPTLACWRACEHVGLWSAGPQASHQVALKPARSEEHTSELQSLA